MKNRKIALVTTVFLRLSNKWLRWKAHQFLIMFDESKTFTSKNQKNRFLEAAFIFDDDQGAYMNRKIDCFDFYW